MVEKSLSGAVEHKAEMNAILGMRDRPSLLCFADLRAPRFSFGASSGVGSWETGRYDAPQMKTWLGEVVYGRCIELCLQLLHHAVVSQLPNRQVQCNPPSTVAHALTQLTKPAPSQLSHILPPRILCSPWCIRYRRSRFGSYVFLSFERSSQGVIYRAEVGRIGARGSRIISRALYESLRMRG